MKGPLPRSKEIVLLFAALALSPDPVFVTDRWDRIVHWNKSAETLLGYNQEEVEGSSCASLLEGCDAFGNRYCSSACPIIQMAKRGEPARHFVLRLKCKNAAVIPVNVTILELVPNASNEFYLAHVLERREERDAAVEPRLASAPGQAPRLTLVEGSQDARARKLTPREIEVLGMVAAGRATPDIARRLHISRVTVRNHIQNILEKLEVHSKAEAVAFAFQKRLV
ncbi:MAG TPA: LuxR C-terminal-related transcriptional regulator [Thermoanaerobaculia bacterium]|nr:LuxR C-terminal-related transcriptional regulator [Thermoanaerobaculia bacterium]